MSDNGHVNGNPDDERLVELSDDDGLDVLPDQTRDDSDVGWGEWRAADEDEHLLAERPPHW
jgi:hypothetical protein